MITDIWENAPLRMLKSMYKERELERRGFPIYTWDVGVHNAEPAASVLKGKCKVHRDKGEKKMKLEMSETKRNMTIKYNGIRITISVEGDSLMITPDKNTNGCSSVFDETFTFNANNKKNTKG